MIASYKLLNYDTYCIVCCRLTVGRETLLHDAYEEIMSCGARDLQKMKIAISFRGEEGYLYH